MFMTDSLSLHSALHYAIIKHIVEQGYAPSIADLARLLQLSQEDTVTALHNLQEYHGVVLHPKSHEIWVIHPFSLAPTNFLVRSASGEWWGNCAWCSLGVAALLNEDVTITTTIGANGRQVTISIQDGKIVESDYYIHFPIPMKNAWDNVIYTCSTMLLFENESQINQWCQRHHISKGDVQPLNKIWEFSKVWYGNHLNPDWKKWTAEEAVQIFEKFGLVNETWQISVSATRF
jgi:hypothetical protein